MGGGGQQELILFVMLNPTVLSECARLILTYVLWVCVNMRTSYIVNYLPALKE